MDTIKVGSKIKIVRMDGEPQYAGREGVVTHIDDAGQIHGTWGGRAIVPEVDLYILLDQRTTCAFVKTCLILNIFFANAKVVLDLFNYM